MTTCDQHQASTSGAHTHPEIAEQMARADRAAADGNAAVLRLVQNLEAGQATVLEAVQKADATALIGRLDGAAADRHNGTVRGLAELRKHNTDALNALETGVLTTLHKGIEAVAADLARRMAAGARSLKIIEDATEAHTKALAAPADLLERMAAVVAQLMAGMETLTASFVAHRDRLAPLPDTVTDGFAQSAKTGQQIATAAESIVLWVQELTASFGQFRREQDANPDHLTAHGEALDKLLTAAGTASAAENAQRARMAQFEQKIDALIGAVTENTAVIKRQQETGAANNKLLREHRGNITQIRDQLRRVLNDPAPNDEAPVNDVLPPEQAV